MDRPFDLDAAELAACHVWLLQLARGLARDDDEAKDLVQETWLHALRRGRRGVREPRAFLRGMLRLRSVRRHHDDRARRIREQRGARGEEVPGPDELVERLDLARVVAEEIARLDEPERSLLLLRYQEGLRPSAIAAARGVPAGTVRAQLSRAHQRLRARLDRRFDGRGAWAGLALGPWALELAPPAVVSTSLITGGLWMSLWTKVVLAAAAAVFTWWVWPAGPRKAAAIVDRVAATRTPEIDRLDDSGSATAAPTEDATRQEAKRPAAGPPTERPPAELKRFMLRDSRTGEPLPITRSISSNPPTQAASRAMHGAGSR